MSDKTAHLYKIQWHAAFRQAIQVEFVGYESVLDFRFEFPLTTDPLKIDAILIKKIKDVPIKKNIAEAYREHNIIEYKGPGDTFSIYEYQKLLVYGNLYLNTEKVKVLDLTLNAIVTRHPKKFFLQLEQEYGYNVHKHSDGIYHVIDHKPFLQIIVTKELPEDENLFLQSLRKNVSVESTRRILKAAEEAKSHLDAYLFALSSANPNRVKEISAMSIKGVKEFRALLDQFGYMDRAFAESMIQEGLKNGMKKGMEKSRQEGIEKGIEKGHWQGKLDVAKRMLAHGMSAEDVAIMTDIPLDRVLALTTNSRLS